MDVIEEKNVSEFENFLSLATQKQYFMFNNIFYKKDDITRVPRIPEAFVV